MAQRDVVVRDGRTVHVHDTHPGDTSRQVVWWHHGTPNVGDPPRPLLSASDRLGLRWVSTDRPGYGGSDPDPGRTVASVAADVADVADALGLDRFAVMGHSGGGPHALACAALLGDRVLATAAVASPAPPEADGLDQLDAAAGDETDQVAGAEGGGEHDLEFTPEDEAALEGRWAWFLDVVRPAQATGQEGAREDAVAAEKDWGFDVATVSSPVLLVHGDADRVVPVTHTRWLAARCTGAQTWERPGDGHITVMDTGEDVLAWLAGHREVSGA